MRVHSLLEGVYGSSWSYMHWDSSVSLVGFVVPQVEAPSVYYSSSLHNSVLMENCSFLICLLCSYPNGAKTPMKTTQNTARDKNKTGYQKG